MSQIEIYAIIDANYHKKNGVGSYSGIENRHEECLDIDYIVRSKKERDFMKFNNSDIHKLVMYWQETKDDVVATALFEHYLLLGKKIMYKYIWAYNGFQQNREGIDTDLYSELYIILHKCLGRFKMVEGGTFTAYMISELRNHYIETARKTSFSIAKMPSSIFREMRKKINNNEKDEFNYLKKAFDPTSSNDGEGAVIDLISTVADPSHKKSQVNLEEEDMIKSIFKIINKKFNERDSLMFIMYSGVHKDYTQKRLGEIFEISPSSVGKKINLIKEYLASNEEIRHVLKGER